MSDCPDLAELRRQNQRSCKHPQEKLTPWFYERKRCSECGAIIWHPWTVTPRPSAEAKP